MSAVSPLGGISGDPKGGPAWGRLPREPPLGGTRRALPFVSHSGWGGGGGVRGREGLKLLLTPRPDLNAGWGADGRPTYVVVFPIGKLLAFRAGNLEMGEGAGGTAARGPRVSHWRAQVLPPGAFSPGPHASVRRPWRVRPGFICTLAQMLDTLTDGSRPSKSRS